MTVPVRLRNVGRRYGLGGPWILRGVDLVLEPGTLVRVVGTNGSGKSTLLRLLAGVDAPSEGRVTGRPRAAYVPERFAAGLPFTAHGYLVHLGRLHGLGGRAAARRADEWLARLGAAEYAAAPMAGLSKGTAQKVAVAQALLAEPGLLVLDEAWTGLDTEARGVVDRAVAERVAAGGTAVFVDHDPRRLAGAADVVHRIAGGTLAFGGEADAPEFGEEAGPRVRIVALGPPGEPLPQGLPGTPGRRPGPGGVTVLAVAVPHADALLRALLTATPPWHIVEVREEGGPS